MNVVRRSRVALMNKKELFQKMMNPKPRNFPVELSFFQSLGGEGVHPVKEGSVFFTAVLDELNLVLP